MAQNDGISMRRFLARLRRFAFRFVAKVRLVIFVFFLIPVALICRIIRPFVWIRFGYFNVNRMGHFVADTAQYLSERELGVHPPMAKDFFFFQGKPANDCVKNMVERELTISPIVEPLFLASRLFLGGSNHVIYPAVTTRGSRDINGITSKALVLGFTEAEEQEGKAYLKSMGIGARDNFVCLIVRDDAYLKKTFEHSNWDYHGYRNSSIHDYRTAIQKLNARGYYVLRMGSVVNDRLDLGTSKFIDYANSSERSDFLDTWLVANCCFAISTSTGLDEVAIAFQRPVVFVNHLPVGDCRTGSERFVELFKRMRWRSTGEYLGLHEQIEYGVVNCYRQSGFDELGIEIIDNSPSEITAAVLEMEDMISRRWHRTAEDEKKQMRFFEILAKTENYSKRHGPLRANISSSFLTAHGDWFLR